MLIGYLRQTIKNLRPEEIEFVVLGNNFRIVVSNRGNEIERKQELLQTLRLCWLYIKTIVIPDSNKLRQVYQKYVDQNEDEAVKFDWNYHEHLIAVILEEHLVRIKIFSFNK